MLNNYRCEQSRLTWAQDKINWADDFRQQFIGGKK
jgi:hypothetical protein